MIRRRGGEAAPLQTAEARQAATTWRLMIRGDSTAECNQSARVVRHHGSLPGDHAYYGMHGDGEMRENLGVSQWVSVE